MGRLQKQVCKLVLDYFEATYTKELGYITWSKIREILTAPVWWQYAVLLNNFTSPSEVEKLLCKKGYHLLFQEALSVCPETLKCYVNKSPGKFPSQRHQCDRLKEYYILNASSLLPILALDVKDGERVLDMCAAPGGKSIALLQCALPGCLHCNEPDIHRSRWLKQTLESYVPKSRMNIITNFHVDGRVIGKHCPHMYDKVLVDAPCSNDRSWLFSSGTDQATVRILQRKTLPAVQTELLRSAINALRPGGSLVYSTCTLSKAENSDVVANILSSCDDVIPVDLTDLGSALSHEFTFASGVRHGLLVLPDQGKSWGPMFVAKFVKKIQ